MNAFIYQNILDEYNKYLEDNFPETIYLDTINLRLSLRDIDVELIYKDIIESECLHFKNILNHDETNELCYYIKKRHSIREFKKLSLDYIDCFNYHIINLNETNGLLNVHEANKPKLFNCAYEHHYKKNRDLRTMFLLCGTQEQSVKNHNDYINNPLASWHDRLNIVQIIGVNAKLEYNRDVIFKISNNVDKYPSTVKLSIKNIMISFSEDPYEKMLDFLDTLENDKKNENFYFSFIKFYHTDYSLVLDSTLESMKNFNNSHIARLLPTLYIIAKRNEFPKCTKTKTDALIRGLKKVSKYLPSETNDKYGLLDMILSKCP